MKENVQNSLTSRTMLTRLILPFSKSAISAGFAKCVVVLLLAPYVSPMVLSVEWKTQYTYANEYREVSLTGNLKLESPKNSFVVELATESEIEDEDAVVFTVTANGTTKEAGLEIAGDEFKFGRYLTSPVHFEPADEIRVTCRGCESVKKPTIRLIALDTRSSVEKLSYDPDAFVPKTHAAISAVSVVSRADWGADESLKYADHPIWVSIFKRQSMATQSEATKKQLEKNAAIESYLQTKYPEESKINEVIRTENGHDLVWPIEKTQNVREIVLHHTAENNVKSLSDPELMRSMYYYHAITRGWGDIGYQYVIGQRGQVYEGRAGGDYAVGAHVNWNNRGTVGISVIGNFEVDAIVKEQQQSIGEFMVVLSKKYGIDTNVSRTGHKACKVDEECLTRDFDTTSLVGHRDIGNTSCPGTNLYAELTNTYIPKLGEATRNNVLIENPVYRPETLKPPVKSPDINIPPVTEHLGPMIRIKISVPNLKKIELEATEGYPTLSWDAKSGGKVEFSKISVRRVGKKVETVMGNKKYRTSSISLGATAVRINNWTRIPAWDNEKKYNDNEFRGKLEIRVEDGKLIVINELPIEMYLRGLAEFSSGENVEKAKTILVAARSYALFYTNPDHRKFPGKPYDGSDDPDVFQKYLGYGYEKRSATTTQYVQETQGEIITLQDRPIKPWYFSQSSGKTLSALEYCE